MRKVIGPSPATFTISLARCVWSDLQTFSREWTFPLELLQQQRWAIMLSYLPLPADTLLYVFFLMLNSLQSPPHIDL